MGKPILYSFTGKPSLGSTVRSPSSANFFPIVIVIVIGFIRLAWNRNHLACETPCCLIGVVRINHCSPAIDTSAISCGRTNVMACMLSKATKGTSFCVFLWVFFPHSSFIISVVRCCTCMLFALHIIVSL